MSNPNASVPGIDLNEPVGTNPLVPVPKDVHQQTTSVRVQNGNLFKGTRFRDYVPSSSAKPKVAVASAVYAGPHRRGVTRLPGYDYLGAKETHHKLITRKKRIKDRAKEIYAQHSQEIRNFHKARAIVDEADQEALEKPDVRLRKAMDIVAKGEPFTKKQAIQQAMEEINTKET